MSWKSMLMGWMVCLATCACQIVNAQNPIPTDAMQTCPLTKQEFDTWFASGAVTLNGVVKPANSLTFTANSNCSFYKWSEQMFLWLTSKNGNAYVFESSSFYDVETQADGSLTMVQHPAGAVRKMGVRASQVGATGKQLKFDSKGNIIENKGVADAATGQAGDSSTLMSQNGSLVYYSTHVNDVFAYLSTGAGPKTTPTAFNPPITEFPVNQTELNQIVAFAASKGKMISDPNALAMELKLSWVDAATLDPTFLESYVTIDAEVPSYDFSVPPVVPTPPILGDPTQKVWPIGKPARKKVALVGMHVVGSVQGHPEMIWATFEHVGNAPNAAYSYINNAGTTVSVAEDTKGKWLFCMDGFVPTPTNVNVALLQTFLSANGGSTIGIGPINPATATKPGHSSTIRSNPWGAPPTNSAQNNTDIISLNNSVFSMLAAGDVRKNYVQIGAVWTTGAIPKNSSEAMTLGKGSTQLQNATMETYQQFANNNCFSCHNHGSQSPPNNFSRLSHIWRNLNPLK